MEKLIKQLKSNLKTLEALYNDGDLCEGAKSLVLFEMHSTEQAIKEAEVSHV